ncbi:cupredoxin domain-containing protein [Neobacillus sp. PS3-12]|uniref:cupredoxin domain-containing protein n=1 Tax=Neobacillus sp. PS3-12 TaxID=3070677 RepID=UPI0027DFBE9E|nr:cupredoxin domain-containing protein [Neobacillus sp. PS3-12]WML53317.1 cupredoxin domain-containing protein [Neobacillus sp. PS3-12]
MKKKITLLITASILSIVMLSACSSNSSQTNQSSTAKVATKKDETSNSTSSKSKTDSNNTTAAKTANASAAPAAGVVEINVNAKDFEYDKKVITVKKGDKVKITLHSDDGGHGLAIPAYNVNIQGNGSTEFTADKAGTFEFFCSVMCGSGHSNMTGKLIVQ